MTRILIISDIHGNLTALEAVLAAAGKVDAVWCLGDLVGYGPEPNECIERVRGLSNLINVCGNHDAAVIGQIQFSAFNFEANESLRWTLKNLTENNLAYLQSLPETYRLDDCLLVHGSPRNPLWEYIINQFTAALNFTVFDEKYCLVGHSHIPTAFSLDPEGKTVEYLPASDEKEVTLKERAILNPGSVGQPRDHDIRASYALFYPETGHWQNMRVKYNIQEVQEKIVKAGLPEKHAYRLDYGI